TSSTAAAHSGRITGLALTSGAAITISYSLIGDLDLDGDLDGDDYARIDSGFANKALGYENGDLDYSGGPANADDYFLIDRTYAATAAPPAAPASATVSRVTIEKHPRKRSHHRQNRSTCRMFRWQLQ